MELFKKKQEYLESQLRNQKIILEKLSSAKSEKEKAVLKEMLDNLAKSITECQQGLKDFIKQKTPTVVTKTEAEKMLLDAELDLYNTLNKCDGEAQQDTAELLLMKVNELKLKAKALGLKESAHEMGLKAKRRHLPFVPKSKQSLKIDNRPKTLCVAGTSERDVKKYFLQQLSDIEKIEERKPGCFIVTFKTRKAAETALSGSRLGNENVTVTWFRDNLRSTLEDLKESNVPKAKDDDNPNEAEGDEDEDEEEDSEARSWRR